MIHKIAIADDHHIVREALVNSINKMPGFEVVMQASSGKEFIEKLKDHPNIFIAIVDLHMPGMDGFETIKWITNHQPEIATLALTVDLTEESMIKAVRSGVKGYVKKNAHPKILKKALDSLVLTGFYLSSETYLAVNKIKHEKSQITSQITPRQQEFLEHVCNEKEYTYEQISDLMGVSVSAVDHFRRELFEKFDIRSKSGLVLFAIKWNLVTFTFEN